MEGRCLSPAGAASQAVEQAGTGRTKGLPELCKLKGEGPEDSSDTVLLSGWGERSRIGLLNLLHA